LQAIGSKPGGRIFLLLVLQGAVKDLLCTRAIQEGEVIGMQLEVPVEEGILDFHNMRLLFLSLLFC